MVARSPGNEFSPLFRKARKEAPAASMNFPSRITKYIGTSRIQSAKRSKPNPSSNTTAGMPVRSGSVSVQTFPRSVR